MAHAVQAIFGLGAAVALAFANGANDNAKPVATLVGAGLTGPRRALLFGTLATLAGSLFAVSLGTALAARFSAQGLVGAELAHGVPFLLSVTVGAALTVLTATRLGLPISTTHAILGAILGAGALLGTVDFAVLGTAFVLPLVASPLVALVATATLYPLLHRLRLRLGVDRESCLCVGAQAVPVPTHAASAPAPIAAVHLCDARYAGSILGIRADVAAATLHWTSALAVSFARGLQDGAKITGIALFLGCGLGPTEIAAVLAFGIAAGGLLAARRVEETMAHRITRMNDGQALLGNLVTAGVVFGATAIGAPVSTTHVITGGLLGVRAHTSPPRENWLVPILLAWIGTLPFAAALAALTALVV